MERAYTIPFRVVYNRAARKERAKRAMKYVREFIASHMKSDPENVKIHSSVNMVVWQRGIEKPPRKLRVVAIKEDENIWVYTQEERASIGEKPEKKQAAKKESTAPVKSKEGGKKKEEKKRETEKKPAAPIKGKKEDGEKKEEKKSDKA